MFGNIAFKVLNIQINKTGTVTHNDNHCDGDNDNGDDIAHNDVNSNTISNNEQSTYKSNNLPKCRICLSEEIDKDNNPLISPCNCSGTVQFIHLECLKLWLQNKITFRKYRCLNILIKKPFQCELCKTNLPNTITLPNNKQISLIQLPVDQQSSNYFTIEHIPKPQQQEHQPSTTFIYTIKFDVKPSIYIGRSSACDLKMTDASISRNHALMQLKNNKIYIRDMNSRFGTFAEFRHNNILFLPNKTFCIIIKQCLFEFTLKRTFTSIMKCTKSKYFLWNDYNSYINDSINYPMCNNNNKNNNGNNKKESFQINTKRSSNRDLNDKNEIYKGMGFSVCNNNTTFVNNGNVSRVNLLGETKVDVGVKDNSSNNNTERKDDEHASNINNDNDDGSSSERVSKEEEDNNVNNVVHNN